MNGCILPGTGIAVDFWDIRKCSGAQLFFLTHLHGDHITGLTSTWQRPIHCSEVTARLLQDRCGIPESLLRPLETDVSHIIPIPGRGASAGLTSAASEMTSHSARLTGMKSCGRWSQSREKEMLEPSSVEAESDCSLMTCGDSVTVTLIDANHCPGSVMFLFEGSFGRILHTGDFRLMPGHLEHPKLAAVSGKVDRLYLDNTYCDSRCDFPTRAEAKESIMGIIRRHPDLKIFIGVRNLGKEDLLADIGKTFQEDVSVSVDMHKVACILEMDDVFRINDPSCRIQTVPFRSISKRQMTTWNMTAPTIAVLPTALFTGLGGQPFVNQPSVFVVPYSDHSSYQELMKFVEFIHPSCVIPIVPGRARGPFGVDISSRADMSCFDHLLTKNSTEYQAETSIPMDSQESTDAVGESDFVRATQRAELPPVSERRRREIAAAKKRRSQMTARNLSVSKRRQRGIEYDETLLGETDSGRKVPPAIPSIAANSAEKNVSMVPSDAGSVASCSAASCISPGSVAEDPSGDLRGLDSIDLRFSEDFPNSQDWDLSQLGQNARASSSSPLPGSSWTFRRDLDVIIIDDDCGGHDAGREAGSRGGGVPVWMTERSDRNSRKPVAKTCGSICSNTSQTPLRGGTCEDSDVIIIEDD